MKELFDRDGYLFVSGMVSNPETLYCPPPLDEDDERITGMVKYHRKDKVEYKPQDIQTPNAFSRYGTPQYKELHYLVRKEVESILGMDLLPTYYFDRFYYVGQDLKRHVDRPSCEVSVTLQISTNSDKPWPIWFQKPDGTKSSVIMKDGDAVIYKGCERDHWRDSLESKYGKWENKWRSFRKKEDDTYHHQIFLHYVNSQGPFVDYAFDYDNK